MKRNAHVRYILFMKFSWLQESLFLVHYDRFIKLSSPINAAFLGKKCPVLHLRAHCRKNCHLALPLTSCVALDRSLNLLSFSFLICNMGVIITTTQRKTMRIKWNILSEDLSRVPNPIMRSVNDDCIFAIIDPIMYMHTENNHRLCLREEGKTAFQMLFSTPQIVPNSSVSHPFSYFSSHLSLLVNSYHQLRVKWFRCVISIP